MDAVINKARELGKLIQQDSRYKLYFDTSIENEQNEALQAQIKLFETQRNELTTEIQKPDKDTARIKELDADVKELYASILASETMSAFTQARDELQDMLSFVNHIIKASSDGENPETIELENCAGSCGSCSGC